MMYFILIEGKKCYVPQFSLFVNFSTFISPLLILKKTFRNKTYQQFFSLCSKFYFKYNLESVDELSFVQKIKTYKANLVQLVWQIIKKLRI